MTIEKKVSAVLGIEGTKWSRGLSQASRDMREFKGEAERQARSVARALAGISIALGVVGLAVKGVVKDALVTLPGMEDALKRVREAAKGIVAAIANSFGSSPSEMVNRFAMFLVESTDDIARAVRGLVDTFSPFLAALRDGVDWATRHRDALSFFATAATLAVAQVWLLTTAIGALNAVMATNPVTAIIAGLITLSSVAITLVIQKMGGLQAAILNVQHQWNMLKNDTKLIVDTLVFEWKWFANAVWEGLKGFASNVGDLFRAVGRVVERPWDPSRMQELFKTLGATAKDTFAPFGDAHEAEMQRILANHRITRFALITDFNRAMADLGKAGAGTPPPKPPATPGGGPETAGLASKNPYAMMSDEELYWDMFGHLGRSSRAIELPPPDVTRANRALEDFSQSARGVYQSMWDSFLDMEMTGQARREMLWKASLGGIFNVIGQATQRFIWGKVMELFMTKTTEQQKTNEVLKGVTARGIAAGTEIATSQAVAQQDAVEGAAKTAKAHAGIPFIGMVLAAGAIAAMFALLRSSRKQKFHTGGLVTGGSFGSEVDITAQRGEFVMPLRATAQYLPLLEMMRQGRAGAAPRPLAPAREERTEVHFHVPRSSILFADDEAALERLASRLHRIEKRVRATYRPLPAGA